MLSKTTGLYLWSSGRLNGHLYQKADSWEKGTLKRVYCILCFLFVCVCVCEYINISNKLADRC